MEANKTISTTDVDPWNLKVKGLDIHVTKNCCIIINTQKISSIHKFSLKVKQILESHELKGHANF